MTGDRDFELTQFLPYLLNQAAEASSREFQQSYKQRYGLLRTEWRVLFHLGLYGRLTARDISQRAQMHKTKISRAVQRLSDLRMIRRERDEDDRRIEHLELTDTGRAAYRDLSSLAAQYDKMLCAELSTDEAILLRQILVKLAARA